MEKLTAQDWRNFKRELIAWYTRRPVFSMIDGRIIGYIKLEVGK